MTVSEPLVQSILLGDAVEHAPVGILVADEEMRYVATNAYACELLGYTREELLRLKITDVARDPKVPDQFAEVQAHGRLDGTARISRKDGVELAVHYRAAETTIADLTYYVAVIWPAASPRP